MKTEKITFTNVLWQKKILWVMVIFITFIIGLSSVNALTCYQESVNSSTIYDGNCSLYFTGTYTFNDNVGASGQGAANWINPYNSIDNDFASLATYYVVGKVGYLFINYTKPAGAIYSTIINNSWKVKDTNGQQNITIPYNCWNYTQSKLSLRVNVNEGTYGVSWYCYNSTNWYLLRNGSVSADRDLYEEGMLWQTQYIENSQTYTTPVLEGSTNTFSINISYDSNYYTSANAYLNYNGTSYAGTQTGTGNTITFSRSVTSPQVTANNNVSFYWVIQLNNGTTTEYYNSTFYNQTINNLVYGVCNGTNTIKLINFTTYDEDTRTQLLSVTYNNTYSIDLKIGDSGLTNYVQYSANASGNSYAICLNTSLIGNLRIDYVVQYSSTSHVTDYYNVQNYTLNTTTLGKNISLYPLATTTSQEYLIKVKDANYLALQGVVIELWRNYVDIGTSLLVEAPKTDSLGNTIGHFLSNDAKYIIYVKKNGQTLGTFNDIQVYCNVAITDCILNLNLQSSSATPSSFLNYLDVSYLPTYDETTKIYTLTYTTTDSSDKTVSIYGYKLDNTDYSLVCSNSITASTGTITCVFPTTYYNNTILINAYVDSSLLFTDYVRATYTHSSIENIKYILMAFLIPFFVLMALANPQIAIVLYIIGLIFGVSIYALDTQSYIGAGSFIIWFIVAGIILLIKIARGGARNG